ncbi:MAG TPA: exodeoxyribonuclease VII large subunit [Acidimicrobiales bacterium]|nr:exodeoxyribonuclease VII large subunit [Acidimicrobiales bacterium]
MTLPLFEEPQERSGPRRVTLVKLSAELGRFAAATGLLAVEGEVHRPTLSKGGRVYFTLRDRAAQVTVTVPRSKMQRSRVVAGERVLVVGRLEWLSDRGQLQMVADEVSPVGAGAIAAMLAETRRRLGRDGLLDRPRRPLPLLPRRVGVVCGADAAVRRDIEAVVAQRFPGYPVHFEETTVSGPGAAVSILDGLSRVVRRPGVDVVIVARGGGDATSLLPWSDEEVCRAVAACPLPVVSAIGHEGDRPLCDEVADARCGTPSIAAGLVIPDRAVLTARLDAALEAAGARAGAVADRAGHVLAALAPARALDSGLLRAEGRLARAGQRLADAHPRRQLDAAERRLAAVDWRRPVTYQLGEAAGRLRADARHLHALDPRRVLARGFAVVTGPDGRVVRRASDLGAGDVIGVELSAGRVAARVETVDPGSTPDPTQGQS